VDLDTAAISEQGADRDVNEDALVEDKAHGLFAIADGVGGGSDGQAASRLAVGTFREAMTSAPATVARLPVLDRLRAAFAQTNAVLVSTAAHGGRSLWTTLTAAVVQDGMLYLAHSGDSRAYVIDDDKASQLTDDHTIVADMVRQGLMSATDAQSHPRRGILSSCLGMHDSAKVQTRASPLTAGQVLVLCTDGIACHLTDSELVACARDEPRADAAAAALAAKALANHSPDDRSALVVRVRQAQPDTPSHPPEGARHG